PLSELDFASGDGCRCHEASRLLVNHFCLFKKFWLEPSPGPKYLNADEMTCFVVVQIDHPPFVNRVNMKRLLNSTQLHIGSQIYVCRVCSSIKGYSHHEASS